MAEEIYLGRQAILDAERRLHGFELLFRSGMAAGAGVIDDTTATTSVIVRTLSDFGINAVLETVQGFINCGTSFLMSEVIELLPPEKLVLEILETTVASDTVRRRCSELKAKGYRLALDDFRGLNELSRSLLPLVDIVKVDILGMDAREIEAVTREVSGLGATLLAEKIECEQEFVQCKALGYHLFQGYFFSRPEVIHGKRLSPAQAVLMKILSLLHDDADTRELEEVFKQNPMLGVRLLRLANSASYSLRAPLKSIGDAIVVLGRRQLQHWVLLLIIAEGSEESNHSVLLHAAAARGKFMELLASALGRKVLPESAFIAGVVSLMDVLLGMPMEKIVSSLGLSPEVSRALTQREGKIGELLTIAEALEGQDNGSIKNFKATQGNGTADLLNRAQGQALSWASKVFSAV